MKGVFPKEYDEIKKLKGIGDYTAGAIASFAFNKSHPVVDGNVFRVLARYFGIKTPIDSTKGKKEFFEKAAFLLDKKNPGIFNQAIMEFGAMQCVPQNPDCKNCPLKKNCRAWAKDLVSSLPVKSKKNKIRTRYFNYVIIRRNGKILIKKRIENDIWKNLYDFPMIETKKEVSPSHTKKMLGINPKFLILNPFSLKHILSHQIIFARFWEVLDSEHKKASFFGKKNKYGLYINENQLNKYAFPRLIEKYFDEIFSKN
jgi:A/G-specific adenine glycosylase